MCSAEDDGTVAIHAHKTNALVGIITRSSLPARSARFDSKGKRLAITSEYVFLLLCLVSFRRKCELHETVY
jgi:hypothetical protein